MRRKESKGRVIFIRGQEKGYIRKVKFWGGGRNFEKLATVFHGKNSNTQPWEFWSNFDCVVFLYLLFEIMSEITVRIK